MTKALHCAVNPLTKLAQCAVMTSPRPCLTYSRNALLSIRDLGVIPALPRQTRRLLWWLKLTHPHKGNNTFLTHSCTDQYHETSARPLSPTHRHKLVNEDCSGNRLRFRAPRFFHRAYHNAHRAPPHTRDLTPTSNDRQRFQLTGAKLLSANIRGLRSNLQALQAALSKYDIICLCETFLNPSVTINFTGFDVYRRDRGLHGGGVAVIIRNGIGAVPIEVPESCDIEAIWVKVNWFPSGKRSIIGAIYRPPGTSDSDSFFSTLDSAVEAVREAHPNAEILICGDTNCHLQEWGDSRTDSAGLAALRFSANSGLSQIVRDATLITKSACQSVIDHVFSDLPDHVISATTVPGMGASDHCGVEVSISLTPQRDRPFYRTFYRYDKADWPGLRDHFHQANWSEVSNGSVDEVWCKWRTLVMKAIDVFIPSRRICLKPNSAPWFGLHCARARDRKIAAWKVWRRHPSLAAYRSYRKACANARHEYVKARRSFFLSMTTKLEENPASTKNFWRAINGAMDRLRCHSLPTLQHEGQELMTSRSKAAVLNEVFAAKATIDDDGRPPPPQGKVTDATMTNVSIQCNDVWKQLRALKDGKATGPDGISARVLRECAMELTPSLTHLFCLTLQEGQIPTGWKHGRITAVHKSGAKANPDNYRPISILPIVSKMLERIINRQLLKYLSENSLLPERQFAFQPGRSAMDMSACLTQTWSDALEKGHEVRIVSLDLSRAFDRVWHDGLLTKLSACGIGGQLHAWLSSFLQERTQSVTVRGQESAYLPVKAGVPQGSVLGPTLFLVFLRDMGDGVRSTLDFYADDCTLHSVVEDRSERATIGNYINDDLRIIQRWADTWHASFNADKTHALTLSRARDAAVNHPPLFFGSHALRETAQITIVGLTINRRLTWGEHIRRLAIKTTQQLGALRRARRCLPQHALLAAYKGTVRARIDYLSPVWCGGPSSDLKMLHKLQRRALAILGLSNASEGDLRALRLQPLQERWAVSSLALLHRMINGTAPPTTTAMKPTSARRSRSTRNGDVAHPYELTVPRSRTQHHQASFLPRTIRQWNALPASTFASDLGTFKVSVSRALPKM